MSRHFTGKYFGTEINGKWWRRSTKNKMLARGNGKFSYDDVSIFFLRTLTKIPITIDLAHITGFSTGTWHGGQWGGGKTIIKVLWRDGKYELSSGFYIATGEMDVDDLLIELQQRCNAVQAEIAG